MARFNSLFDAGEVLLEMIADVTNVADIHVGPPLVNAGGNAEAIRITLLWTSQQPTHRNDPFVTNPDGSRTPPPLTLYTFYLITTYGTANDDAVQAHNLLGQVMQIFHSNPDLDLPVVLPGGPTPGDGRLRVTQMPVTIEMLEKVFTPLQLSQRPWVLYEVSPVQLVNLQPPQGPTQLVRPGGVNLLPLEARTPPVVERVTPASVAVGGNVRVDVAFQGVIDRVSVGRARLTGGALTIPVPNGPVIVTLPTAGPNAVLAGTYDLTATSGLLISQPTTITVADPAIPSVSAPLEVRHSIALDLVLTGSALNGVLELFAWPDEGLTSPPDVRMLPVAAAANSVTVTAANLGLANLRVGLRYRLSARHGANRFTPYVLLEFVP